MNNAELLKNARNLLLSLHKDLVDFERALYEGINGPVTSGQFLNLLLEDQTFKWLRRFSVLIVDIDEMFAQKDGYSDEAVEAHLAAMRELVDMSDDDEDFRSRYQSALQQNPGAAGKHGEIRSLLRME